MIELRPSASSHWFHCAAQPRLAMEVVEQVTDPAREGTCAAWVAEMVLKGDYPSAKHMLGLSHENGWLIEADMVDYVQGYVDHVKSRGGDVHTERHVRLNEMIAGTPDSFAIYKDDLLIVDDLKYGFDIVNPYRNTQISIYAAAIYNRYLAPYDRKVRKIIIGVYQPRAAHPDGIYRTWEVFPEDLFDFIKEIIAAGHNAQSVDAMATPGFHCNHCKAAANCVALASSVYEAYRTISSSQSHHMNDREISTELRFLTMFETMVTARKKSVEAEAVSRIKNSGYIPGWAFENRVGKSKLSVSPEIAEMLTGKNAYAEPKPCTPAELIRRGANKETVKRLSTRPNLEPKLIPVEKDHFAKMFERKETK